MTTPTVQLTLPYPASAELTGTIYAELEAAFGEDVDIALDDDGQRSALQDLAPHVLVLIASLEFAGKAAATALVEELTKRAFTTLMRRLRRPDDQGPEYDVHLRTPGVPVTFVLDADALDDPRALAAIPLVAPSAYRPHSTLAWNRQAGRWYPVSPQIDHD